MSRKAAAILVNDPGKAARVEQERARIMALFDGADGNRLDFIRETVKQLAWLAVSIQDLQADIDENGAVVPYQNGRNQGGLQQNPSCKLLVDLEKIFNTKFRALLPVLPEKPQTTSLDLLRMEFEPEPKTPEEIEAERRAEEEKRKRIDAEIAAAQKLLDERRAKNGR